MIFKKLKNRKGFSLVEVAIAMAVVSIVTITAIAIIYPATDKTKEANAQSNALYFAADVIECFKATKNPNELQVALSEREGVSEITFDTYPGSIIGQKVASGAYRVDSGNCRIDFEIFLSGSDSTGAVLDYAIEIEVQDGTGNTFWSTRYVKEARFKNEN